MIVGDTIVHEVRYAHSIDAVWRAITEPTAIAAWLMANDFVAERGHRFHLDASPSYGVVDCEVVDVEPPTLLRCTWMLGDVASVVTIRLREDDGDTVLHLEHELVPQPVTAQRVVAFAAVPAFGDDADVEHHAQVL